MSIFNFVSVALEHLTKNLFLNIKGVSGFEEKWNKVAGKAPKKTKRVEEMTETEKLDFFADQLGIKSSEIKSTLL